MSPYRAAILRLALLPMESLSSPFRCLIFSLFFLSDARAVRGLLDYDFGLATCDSLLPSLWPLPPPSSAIMLAAAVASVVVAVAVVIVVVAVTS